MVIKVRIFLFPTANQKTKYFFSVSDKSKPGVPKVIKRRAPAPINDGSDISISRPVATKVDHSKGMIPPPPLKTQSQPIQSTSKPVVRPASPKPAADRSPSRQASPIPRKSPTPPPPKPLAETIKTSYSPQSLSSVTGSSESLVKSSPQSSPQPSPTTLRPGQKVTDVTTIRRQPKTGWL